ncbi:hypothetical protein GCM10023156_25620 [Novipirellula rosea]|uniref:Transposase DDE domain-containing protein n=1 Tax=Novipirellula rosea TaxID=1031540 RepID=A0ABP8MPA7_9BACT
MNRRLPVLTQKLGRAIYTRRICLAAKYRRIGDFLQIAILLAWLSSSQAPVGPIPETVRSGCRSQTQEAK